MTKKHPIHLISTDSLTLSRNQLWTHNNGSGTSLRIWDCDTTPVKSYELAGYCIPQFLYICSDEEIKDHEHSIDISTNKLILKTERGYGRLNLRKIIATNNPELWENPYGSIYQKFVSKIDEKWIKNVYIPAYNSGKPIAEVELEYDEHLDGIKYSSKTNTTYILKLSNGNVIIKAIEEKLYTKEDFLNGLKFFIKDTRADKPWQDADNEWFNKNYPL